MGVSSPAVSRGAKNLSDRLESSLSDVVVSNPGVPQGTVLAPLLVTLHTTDRGSLKALTGVKAQRSGGEVPSPLGEKSH